MWKAKTGMREPEEPWASQGTAPGASALLQQWRHLPRAKLNLEGRKPAGLKRGLVGSSGKGQVGDQGLTLLGLLRTRLRFAVQKAAALALTASDHCLLAGVAGASSAVIASRAVSWQERRGTGSGPWRSPDRGKDRPVPEAI